MEVPKVIGKLNKVWFLPQKIYPCVCFFFWLKAYLDSSILYFFQNESLNIISFVINFDFKILEKRTFSDANSVFNLFSFVWKPYFFMISLLLNIRWKRDKTNKKVKKVHKDLLEKASYFRTLFTRFGRVWSSSWFIFQNKRSGKHFNFSHVLSSLIHRLQSNCLILKF